MDTLRLKAHTAAEDIGRQRHVVATVHSQYNREMLSLVRTRLNIGARRGDLTDTMNVFSMITGGDRRGRLQKSVDAHIHDAKAHVGNAEDCVAYNEERSANLRKHVEVEKRNLDFMEASIGGVVRSIAGVAVKLEAELGAWYNMVTDSLYHSKYHGKHSCKKFTSSICLQEVLPES
jgi:hypothetical protein